MLILIGYEYTFLELYKRFGIIYFVCIILLRIFSWFGFLLFYGGFVMFMYLFWPILCREERSKQVHLSASELEDRG